MLIIQKSVRNKELLSNYNYYKKELVFFLQWQWVACPFEIAKQKNKNKINQQNFQVVPFGNFRAKNSEWRKLEN